MYLIVGLGNYGKEYENTPHNMGFLTADKLADKIGFTFSKNKCHALIAEGFYNNEKILGTNEIFTCGNNVLWVVGKRISSYFNDICFSKQLCIK